jgi:hypothetical protein
VLSCQISCAVSCIFLHNHELYYLLLIGFVGYSAMLLTSETSSLLHGKSVQISVDLSRS